MKKKNNSDRPAGSFGVIGTTVLTCFILFFMLLPGSLIIWSAIRDFLSLAQQAPTLPPLTGAAIALIMGLVLAGTGVIFLKTILIKPAPASPPPSQ